MGCCQAAYAIFLPCPDMAFCARLCTCLNSQGARCVTRPCLVLDKGMFMVRATGDGLSQSVQIHAWLLAAAAAVDLQVVSEHATLTVPTWTHCRTGTGSAGCAWKTVTASWQGRKLWTLQVCFQVLYGLLKFIVCPGFLPTSQHFSA